MCCFYRLSTATSSSGGGISIDISEVDTGAHPVEITVTRCTFTNNTIVPVDSSDTSQQSFGAGLYVSVWSAPHVAIMVENSTFTGGNAGARGAVVCVLL